MLLWSAKYLQIAGYRAVARSPRRVTVKRRLPRYELPYRYFPRYAFPGVRTYSEETHFIKDLPDDEGEHTSSTSEGTLEEELTADDASTSVCSWTENGVEHWEGNRYYGNGNLQSQAVMVDKKLHTIRNYNENGKLQKETQFAKGVMHGSITKYYESGQLFMKMDMKNGELDGECKQWLESGELVDLTTFKNNVIQNTDTFYKSGQIASRTPYEEGKSHGAVKKWHENGRVMSTTLVDGRTRHPNGRVKGIATHCDAWVLEINQWFDDGQIQVQVKRADGSGHQEYKVWYEDGQLAEIGTLFEGNFAGETKTWYRNGRPALLAFWKNGEECLYEEWTEDGTLLGGRKSCKVDEFVVKTQLHETGLIRIGK